MTPVKVVVQRRENYYSRLCLIHGLLSTNVDNWVYAFVFDTALNPVGGWIMMRFFLRKMASLLFATGDMEKSKFRRFSSSNWFVPVHDFLMLRTLIDSASSKEGFRLLAWNSYQIVANIVHLKPDVKVSRVGDFSVLAEGSKLVSCLG